MPGTVIRVTCARARESSRAAARRPRGDEDGDPVSSPYDGTVPAVHVAAGDRVAGGAVLVELESAALRRRAARQAWRSRDSISASRRAGNDECADDAPRASRRRRARPRTPARRSRPWQATWRTRLPGHRSTRARRQPRDLVERQPTLTFTSRTTIVAPTSVQNPSIAKFRGDPLGEPSMSKLIAKRRPEHRHDRREREEHEHRLQDGLPSCRTAAPTSSDPQRPISRRRTAIRRRSPPGC